MASPHVLSGFDLSFLDLKDSSSAVLTVQNKSSTPSGHVCLLPHLPFLSAEVQNPIFSCIYKTDSHEDFDSAIEFTEFHRDLSMHIALLRKVW